MIAKIQKVKDKVEHILNRRADVRDNDELLIALIWYAEMRAIDPKMSASQFLTFLSEGKWTSPEAIRRSRQKLQEEKPSLRGTKYKERKKVGETVAKDINEA